MAPKLRGQELKDRFRWVYGLKGTEVLKELERRVIGDDFGANGYTTRAEADRLARLLGLAPGRRLLDVGAGRGWPGLYMARETGCEVVVTDLPLEGLAPAHARAVSEGIGDRASAVAAEGTALPLRPRSFHAVVHTDVIC